MVTQYRVLGTTLLLALVLTACSLGGPADSPPAPQESPEGGEAATSTPQPAPTATAVPPTEAPTETAEAAPGALPAGDDIPQGSSALKASNPSQVSLTGGKPRLVEFFAFW